MREPKIILTDLFRMTKPNVTVTVTSRIHCKQGTQKRRAAREQSERILTGFPHVVVHVSTYLLHMDS